MTDRLATDERAVSIAVTHVLTIGITTILISGLLIGASGMLETQRERAGSNELQSIGDRTADEIVTAADRGYRNDANVTVHSRQPSGSVGGSYSVRLTDESECLVRDGYDGCLKLDAGAEDLSARIPLAMPHGSVDVVNGTAVGGQVVVVYDNSTQEVTIRGETA